MCRRGLRPRGYERWRPSAVTGTPRVTAPLILSPIVPLNDRRGVPGETAQPAVAVAEPEIAVHSEVLAARSVSETEIGRVKPSNSHESTEPFVIVRKEEAAAQSTAQEETPPAEADDRRFLRVDRIGRP